MSFTHSATSVFTAVANTTRSASLSNWSYGQFSSRGDVVGVGHDTNPAAITTIIYFYNSTTSAA
jgi:hypothetical protein